MNCINLITANPADRVALRGVKMHSVLAAMSQKTVVEQAFVNREPRAIEAVYTFPLPDGAAVCAFEVVTGDRVLTGVVDESDRAIEKYESAIEQGDAAYLAEQERPDVFTIRVGNIKPGQVAVVKLTYVCPLEAVDNEIRVSFPTTVAPRFATDSGMDPADAQIDADALNPPHVLSVPYGLTLSADVKLGRKVKRITSPSHSIQVTGDDKEGYAVSLTPSTPREGSDGGGREERTVAMDREVVLRIELGKEVGPSVQYEVGKDNQSFLAVTFVPEFDSLPSQLRANETIFVLDCSGSMAGRSILEATAALELCLRSMNVGDTFNICKFGSNFELMSPEPIVYSQESLELAIGYISRQNSFGGTELLQPLRAIFDVKPSTGVVRSIILLTDGQVTNEPAILKLARKHRDHNRIFSFGIGPSSSSFLVKGLARATGGCAEFISYGEKIHEKVLRTFARIASPLASDVHVDWDGAEAQTLAEFPPIFDGEVLTVFARVPGRRPGEVTLKCRTEAGEQSWKAAVPAAPLKGSGIATMWARRTIQSLEEVNGIARSASIGNESRERAMVVALSKEFGILSSLTMFVAVEHRTMEERNDGRPALRRVPVMLAHGWGDILAGGRTRSGIVARRRNAKFGSMPIAGMGEVREGGSSLLDLTREADDAELGAELLDEIAPSSANPASGSPSSAPSAAEGSARFFRGFFRKEKAVPAGSVRDSVKLSPPVPPADNTVAGILMRQSAEGDFEWDGEMEKIAGMVANWTELLGKAEAFVPAGLKDRVKVVATVRALLLLQVKFAGDEGIWKRAAAKGVRYVAKATGLSQDAVSSELNRFVPG
jgi:Ca-activated chloride channel family protein